MTCITYVGILEFIYRIYDVFRAYITCISHDEMKTYEIVKCSNNDRKLCRFDSVPISFQLERRWPLKAVIHPRVRLLRKLTRRNALESRCEDQW